MATFVSCFVNPTCSDERQFERLLWQQLQALHDHDTVPWTGSVSANPEDPAFAFSYAGYAIFIVGLHAGSSRWARRFAWPTLVFNAHRQFEHLREQGRFERFQQVIRMKDSELQGEVNPVLLTYRGRSAARQYSGRFVEEEWRCPFHAR